MKVLIVMLIAMIAGAAETFIFEKWRENILLNPITLESEELSSRASSCSSIV